MALTARTYTNVNPFAPKEEFLYMLIDVTTVEQTHVVLIGNMRRVQLLGALKAAEGQGRKLIAPPLQGRGFSKLDKLQLQYLYWNTVKQTPPEDYGKLVQDCLDVINKMEPNKDSIGALEYLVEQLEPSAPGAVLDESGQPIKPAAKDPNAPPARPKGTTTTGVIWTICDEVLQAVTGGQIPQDWKPVRDEAWKRCEMEGFNNGTFGVQYSKWRKSKTVGS